MNADDKIPPATTSSERAGSRGTGRAATVADKLGGLNVPRIEAWAAEHVEGIAPPLHFERIGNGRSNLTFMMRDAAARNMVLRRPPLGRLLPTAHDMVREHRILAALTQTDVPVPAPIALYESADLTGAPFYVMEHVAGYVVTDLHSAEALAADARDHVGPSLTAALAKLHAVDVDAVGLGDLGRRNGYVERQLQRWTRQWDASKTREIPAIDRLATRLSAAIPQQQDVALVHGDYRLDNLVVGNDGEVRAVLDWELCTLGDPLADVGLLLAYWPQASARPTEFLTPEQVIEAYARASGRDVTNVPFFHALGYWKLAVIVQGVYRRLVDHPTSGSDDPTKLAPLVDQLAERAELTAHKAGL